MKFVLVVGQDLNGAPATAATVAEYLAYHDGYQPGWITVADPNWAIIETIIDSTSDAIPAHYILDKDMVLRFASSSSDFVYSAETKLIQILAQQGL